MNLNYIQQLPNLLRLCLLVQLAEQSPTDKQEPLDNLARPEMELKLFRAE
jgi:hypothetical protein